MAKSKNSHSKKETVKVEPVKAEPVAPAPVELAVEETVEETSFEQAEIPEEKVHLEFYGSDVIREKAPQVMEIADAVASEWVKDGSFDGLPLGHPLAQVAAAKALRKAKDVEKRLEEKGVLSMAKIGFDFVKSKIEKRS